MLELQILLLMVWVPFLAENRKCSLAYIVFEAAGQCDVIVLIVIASHIRRDYFYVSHKMYSLINDSLHVTS